MPRHNPCAQTNALVLTGLFIKASQYVQIQGAGSLCPYSRARKLSVSVFVGTVSVLRTVAF